MTTAKKVGIIGSGQVAQAFANGFRALNYHVMVGTRDVAKLAGLEGVEKGSIQQAVQFADLLVLCVKGTIANQVLHGFDLSHKIIIDPTNPIADVAPVNGVLQYFTAANHSLLEALQADHPNAYFVKAFNSAGSHLFYQPDFGGVKPTMFYCGDHQPAKAVVKEIIELFGWEACDMGSKESAHALEALCVLWCIPGFRENRWVHAFKLLTH